MGSVDVYTKPRMDEIVNATLVSAEVNEDGHLIFTRFDETTQDAGNVQAPNLADASTIVKGIVELADDTETIAGTDPNRAVTPASLAARTATATRRGLIEIATTAESITGTDPDRAVTPLDLKAVLDSFGFVNPVFNADFRINHRPYISGAALIPGCLTAYGHDGWYTPGRTNLIKNGNVRTALGNWTNNGGGTISRQTGLSGGPVTGVTTFLRNTFASAVNGGAFVGPTASTDAAVVVATKTYNVSVWVRCSVVKTIQLLVEWKNIGNGTIGSNALLTSVVLVANTWTRISASVVAPDGAAFAGPNINATAAFASGNTLDSLGWQVTEGTDLLTSFDGASSGSVWSGTASASSSVNRAVLTSYSFTQTPQGCIITLVSGSGLQRVMKRANLKAGNWTFGHDGTATMRVYNVGNPSPPLFAASPVQVTLDGLDDVIIEFEASGGTKTISNVRGFPGDVLYSYRPRLLLQERELTGLPRGRVKRSQATVTITAITWFILDDIYFSYDIIPENGSLLPFNTDSDAWTVSVDGIYKIEAAIILGTAVTAILAIKKNNTTLDGSGAVLGSSSTGVSSWTQVATSGEIHLVAGDKLRLALYVSANAIWNTEAVLAGVGSMSYFGVSLVRAD